MGYTLGRVWIEALRHDHANHILGLRLNDWTSILVFLGGLAVVPAARRVPRRRASRRPTRGGRAEAPTTPTAGRRRRAGRRPPRRRGGRPMARPADEAATSSPSTSRRHRPRSRDPPRAPRRHRRLAAADRLRHDGRPGLELRADRRRRRRQRQPAHGGRWPGSPAWSAGRSRWPPASTSRCRARTSRRAPRSRSSGTSCAYNPQAELAELTADLHRPRRRPRRWPRWSPSSCRATPSRRWSIHAQEELGVDPTHCPARSGRRLVRVSFTVGALIPLLPVPVRRPGPGSRRSSRWSRCSSPARVTSRFTARRWLFSGSRQLVLGPLAAAVTYGVGHLLGASIG